MGTIDFDETGWTRGADQPPPLNEKVRIIVLYEMDAVFLPDGDGCRLVEDRKSAVSVGWFCWKPIEKIENGKQ